MPFDPEEFKLRRQERAQQRMKDRRRLTVRLVAAGVVLALCGILIAVLATAGDDSAPSPETTVQTQSPDQITVIHLAAAGDLHVTEAVIASAGTDLSFSETFLDVAALLADADIATVNLEGNFYGQPYGTDRSAPPSLAQALRRAGVDLVQLANSYSIYKGMDGLRRTIGEVRSAGMEPIGVYGTAQEATQQKGYTLCSVKGVKIAFVAFTKGMDGMALPAGNEGCVNLLYTDYATDYQEVDTQGITRVLSAVNKEKPDLTVALLHWGSEYNNTISQSQKQICNLMQENGVDAIIGTHSHYVQQMVLDREKGTFVAYSLGDFLGDADRAGSEYSVILDLEITKDNATGQTAITDYRYTPIFTVRQEEQPLRVVRIRESIAAFEGDHISKISQQTYDDMTYALKRIDARVSESIDP